jgi:hypothetical protein
MAVKTASSEGKARVGWEVAFGKRLITIGAPEVGKPRD